MNKREYLRDYYNNNKERLKAQKAKWYRKNRERLLVKSSIYSKENREHLNEMRRKRSSHINYKGNPFKVKARKMLRDRVRSGKVKKLPCVVCGEVKSQGHHEDYSKPLDVIWLCAKHHAEKHKATL